MCFTCFWYVVVLEIKFIQCILLIFVSVKQRKIYLMHNALKLALEKMPSKNAWKTQTLEKN